MRASFPTRSSQRGDRMVFVIESQYAAMGASDPGYRATMSIKKDHRPVRH
jgi:hypothetical protein